MNEKIQSILVVGSINMDLVLESKRIPKRGESLIGENYNFIPGGKGANQAVAAARLGMSVSLLGKIGLDINGSELKNNLNNEDISTQFLFTDKLAKTGLAIVLLESTGENRILVYPGANMTIERDEIHNTLQRHYDAVMIQFEISQEAVIETCRLAKEKKIPVLVDAGPAQDFPLEKIKDIQILSPNETEAYSLTGVQIKSPEDAVKAAKVLYKRSNAEYIIIKLGEKGSVLFCNEKFEHFPAHKVKTVDTTAAGDAFMAGLAVQWLRHGDIRRAIKFASIVGALATTRLGAQPSLPQLNQFEAFIKKEGIEW